MKQKPVSILMTIASSEVDVHSLSEFARWVHRIGPSELVKAVMHVRRVAKDVLRDSSQSSGRYVPRKHSERRVSPRGASSAVRRTETLLQKELGLSVSAAASLLLPVLANTLGRLPENAAPKPKESFDRWLRRLTRDVSPSQLLHVASMIRNRTVHDWPLRERS